MAASVEKYVVKDRDTLNTIAKKYGIKDWEDLWKANDDLRATCIKRNQGQKKKAEERIQAKDVVMIPFEMSPKLGGGQQITIRVQGKDYAFKDEKEFDAFKKDSLRELKRVALSARIRADAALDYWDYFDKLNKEQYVVSQLVGFRGPKLPNESDIKKAVGAADRLEAAVSAGDFGKIKTALLLAEMEINPALRDMQKYRDRVIGRSGKWIDGLEVTKTVSFAVVAAAATPAGAGYGAAAAAAGSTKLLEISADEFGKMLSGADRTAGQILGRAAWESLIAAGIGALFNSKQGSELIEGVCEQLAKKATGRVSEKVAASFFEKFLAHSGQAVLETAIEQVGKALTEGTTWKEFRNEILKSAALGGLVGRFNDAVDENYAKSIADKIPDSFWKGPFLVLKSTCKPKDFVESLLQDGASATAGSALDWAIEKAKGTKAPEELVDAAAAKLVKDPAFLAKLEAATKTK